MKRGFPLLLVLAVIGSGAVHAHAKIVSTVPLDGDFVTAPDRLVLTFDKEVKLTGLEVKTVAGDTVDLGTIETGTATAFTIALPESLPPGEYYVIWRSIATDSHFSTGEFFFTVLAEE